MSNWIIFLVGIINCILVLFIKHYLSSYMNEKGKNLATKEDIQKITELTEEVQQEFRKEMEQYKSDLHFKYNYYNEQYRGLYCYVYAIVVQSEYVREYIRKVNGIEIHPEDVPFITITPLHRTTQKIEMKSGENTKISSQTEDIKTPVSQFNFETLVDYIIENSALANQELMRLAVRYRFANHVIEAKTDNKDAAEAEAFELQTDIIKSIVKTYNWLRKELKMEYNEWELENGTFI